MLLRSRRRNCEWASNKRRDTIGVTKATERVVDEAERAAFRKIFEPTARPIQSTSVALPDSDGTPEIVPTNHSIAVDSGRRRPSDSFDPSVHKSILEAIKGIIDAVELTGKNSENVLTKMKHFADKLEELRRPRRHRRFDPEVHMPEIGQYEEALDIPGLPDGVAITERFDFGGHVSGRAGPHIQYDLVLHGNCHFAAIWSHLIRGTMRPPDSRRNEASEFAAQ